MEVKMVAKMEVKMAAKLEVKMAPAKLVTEAKVKPATATTVTVMGRYWWRCWTQFSITFTWRSSLLFITHGSLG